MFAILFVKELRFHQCIEDRSGLDCVVPRLVEFSDQRPLSREVNNAPSDVPLGLRQMLLQRPLIHRAHH